MVQTLTKSITLEEFLQLPETKPASEYIDGQVIQKTMPQGQHSLIQGDLTAAINAILKPQKVARAFLELRCIFGGSAIVPDISVFVWDRIPRYANGKIANVFEATPDWAIEILSPEQRQTKIVKKILRCLESGMQMGWLIDPEEETVFVYQPQQKIECFEDSDRSLPTPEFAGEFQLTVGELFGWLSQ